MRNYLLRVSYDLFTELFKFAERMKMTKRLQAISLGQGQGVRAEAMFKTALNDGNWVFFQVTYLHLNNQILIILYRCTYVAMSRKDVFY